MIALRLFDGSLVETGGLAEALLVAQVVNRRQVHLILQSATGGRLGTAFGWQVIEAQHRLLTGAFATGFTAKSVLLVYIVHLQKLVVVLLDRDHFLLLFALRVVPFDFRLRDLHSLPDLLPRLAVVLHYLEVIASQDAKTLLSRFGRLESIVGFLKLLHDLILNCGSPDEVVCF